MKPIAVGIHGFNDRTNGESTVGQMDPYLRDAGFHVDSDQGDYGYFSLFEIRWIHGEKRRKVLYRLAKAIESADLVYTHSNGAHFANTAMRMLPAEVQQRVVVVNISAAMDCDTEPAPATRAELNLCTPFDFWVRLSSYIPFMAWGRRGAWGYCGKASNVFNEFHPHINRHSGWFKPEQVESTTTRTIEFWRNHQP